MHDKNLDRRMPFELNRQALEDLDSIFARAKRSIDEMIAGAQRQPEGDKFQRNSERQPDIRYQINCSDQTSNRLLELHQLINYPNYRDAQIVNLTAEVGGPHGYPRISVELKSRAEFENVRCKITGEDDFINTFTIQLNAWLNSVRKGYWWLYKAGMIGGFLIFYLLSTAIAFLWASWQLPINDRNNLVIVFFFSLVFSMPITWLIYPMALYMRRFAFPLGEFVIGHGIDRQRRRGHVLYTLIGVMVIGGVMVGLFVNFLSSRLF
jgi:hypothetical protein